MHIRRSGVKMEKRVESFHLKGVVKKIAEIGIIMVEGLNNRSEYGKEGVKVLSGKYPE